MERLTEIKSIDNKLIPNKIAQKCPVCNGWGTVANGTKTCGGCDGKCYIIVDQRDIQIETHYGQNTDRHE